MTKPSEKTKTMNQLSTVASAVAALLMPISALAWEQKVENPSRKLNVPVRWRTRSGFRIDLQFLSKAKAERIAKQMDKLKENAAWAASPRAREEFPELRFVREPEVFGHGEQQKTKNGYVNAK